MSGIRVVMAVTPANPELFSELRRIPPRLRAERVRTLATIGLAAVSGGLAVAKPPAPDPPATDRVRSLAKTLGNVL